VPTRWALHFATWSLPFDQHTSGHTALFDVLRTWVHDALGGAAPHVMRVSFVQFGTSTGVRVGSYVGVDAPFTSETAKLVADVNWHRANALGSALRYVEPALQHAVSVFTTHSDAAHSKVLLIFSAGVFSDAGGVLSDEVASLSALGVHSYVHRLRQNALTSVSTADRTSLLEAVTALRTPPWDHLAITRVDDVRVTVLDRLCTSTSDVGRSLLQPSEWGASPQVGSDSASHTTPCHALSSNRTLCNLHPRCEWKRTPTCTSEALCPNLNCLAATASFTCSQCHLTGGVGVTCNAAYSFPVHYTTDTCSTSSCVQQTCFTAACPSATDWMCQRTQCNGLSTCTYDTADHVCARVI
jgi:hypothetical protein